VQADIPEALEDVILRSMDPSPAKRFGSVHELGARLEPFASEGARARWRPYYHQQPKPFDPTTGSISGVFPRDAEPQDSASGAATHVVALPDFAAHDRTTRVSGQEISSAEPSEATVLDRSPAGAEQPTGASIAPMTVDVPMRPTREVEAREVPAPPQPSSTVSAANPTLRRVRFRIFAAFGLAIATVVVATIGAIRFSGRGDAHGRPAPPAWTRAASGSLPTPSAPAAAAPTPAVTGSPSPHPANAGPTPGTAGEALTAPPPAPKHHKRRRAAPTPESAIQYGADEMPIIR